MDIKKGTDPKLTTDIPTEPFNYPGKPLGRRFDPEAKDTKSETMSVIYVNNISKTYKMGDELFWALKGVSFEIHEGEFVAILGPSGSGKSTLLHIIGGLDKPTEGEVAVDGEAISVASDKELAVFRNKKVGFVFQFFNLIPRTNVFDNVCLPLIYSKQKGVDAKEKVKQTLSLVGLSEKLQNKPSELSGGEQQRVAIARALINDPRIILADEPTGNLDTKTGEEILKILLSLKNKGKTIVMVTHEKHLADATNRMLTIKDGRLV